MVAMMRAIVVKRMRVWVIVVKRLRVRINTGNRDPGTVSGPLVTFPEKHL